MRILKCPINGARHRPPALAVLAALPAGARLMLEPEPDNYVDEFAIRVYTSPTEIPESEHAALGAALPNCGHSLESVLAAERIFLGYCASSATEIGRKSVAALPGGVGNAELGLAIAESGVETPDCQLGFAESGWPIVILTLTAKGGVLAITSRCSRGE